MTTATRTKIPSGKPAGPSAILTRRTWKGKQVVFKLLTLCTRESPVETDGSDTSDSRLR